MTGIRGAVGKLVRRPSLCRGAILVLLILLIPSMALRVAVFALEAPVIFPDTSGYTALAANIAAGDLHEDWGFRPPGYPLVVLAAGQNTTAVAAVQVFVLGLATTLLIAGTVWLLCGSVGWSLLAGWLYGLNLGQIQTEMTVLPEAWCTFLLSLIALGVVIIHRRGASWRWIVVVALASATLSLSRSQYLFVPLVLVVAISIWLRPRWGRALGFAALALLPVLVWSGYNYSRLDYFGPTTQAGFSLTNLSGAYIADAPAEYATIRDIYIAQVRARDGQNVNAIWQVMGEMSSKTGLTYPELSRQLTSMSLGLFLHHPGQYLRQVAANLVPFWKGVGRYGSPLHLARSGLPHLIWVAQKYFYVAVAALFLALVAILAVPPARHRLLASSLDASWWLLVSIVILACITQALVEYSGARYGLPVQPLVGALTCAALAAMRQPWRRGQPE